MATIRQAGLADVDVIVAHRRKMFEDMGDDDPARLSQAMQVFVPWLRERLVNGYYRGWLAENDAGEVVAGAGLMLLDWPPGPLHLATQRGYILNVYTERPYRGQGLARLLVQTIMDWCAGQGIYTVSLHASDQGRPIYEKLGFKATNEMRILLPEAL